MKTFRAPRPHTPTTPPALTPSAQLAGTHPAHLPHNYPKSERLYAMRIICVVLCQGAALHYIDGKNGIKDFDVWTFYAEHPEVSFPYRRIGHRDFGSSKFGFLPNDIRPFKGRRVDLIGRSLPVKINADPVKTIRQYLEMPRTKSARMLAQKAVVMIHPKQLLGTVVSRR